MNTIKDIRQRCWCGAFATEWSETDGILCDSCGDEIPPIELIENGYIWNTTIERWVHD